tara:strand:- start:442 stop:555 length:114 start_codon:yes stop_codon:yes gene_type:complete
MKYTTFLVGGSLKKIHRRRILKPPIMKNITGNAALDV